MKSPERFTATGFFFLAFIPLIVFIAVVFFGYVTYRNNEVRAALQEEERMHVNNAFYRVASGFDGVISDLLILSKSDSLREYIEQEAKTFQVAKTFTLIARERKIYEQIRYIDGQGQEVIVINYEGRRPYLEWPENLRDISKDTNFARVSKLKPGVVYFSKVRGQDSAVRGGEDQVSRVFTTVATPIFDKQGTYRGMVALSLKSAPFLDMVRSQWLGEAGTAMVVSSDSRFILSPSLGEGVQAENRFALLFPMAWETIRQNDAGQHLNDTGLFTFKKLTPRTLEDFHGSSLKVIMEQGDIDSAFEPYDLSVIGFIPNATIKSHIAISPFNWGMLLISILFSIVLSSVYMQMRLRQREANKHIQLVAHVEKVTRDGVVIYDDKERIVSVNPAFTILTGYLPYEALGKKSDFFREESLDDKPEQPLLTLAGKKDSAYREVRCVNKKGVKFPIASTVSVMRTGQGDIENYIEIFSDITYLKRKESKLLKQAYYDALTSVPNRLLFEERLKMVLKNSRRRSEKFALLFIDVNDFKGVNDRYGHEVGDKVLVHVADSLSSGVRESDTVARLGGDEFVVIASNVHGKEDANKLVAKLTELVETPLSLDDGQKLITRVSVGVSIYPDDSESETGLTKVADLDMYRNKAQKKSADVLNDITKKF